MEAIFKYIFTMLVGAMFLIFFIGFAYKQVDRAETTDALVLIRGFDDYLLLLTANEEAKDVKDFSSVTTIGFNEGKITSRTEKTSTNRIVYAPKTLTGKKITARTMKWAFPYPIDSFFYITNEKYKQVIVYDDKSRDFVMELMEDINTTFDIKAFSKTDLSAKATAIGNTYQGMARVTFLLISDDKWETATKNKVKAAIPKAVFISAIGQGEETGEDENAKWRPGEITFGDGEKADYIGKEMLIGALYTEDIANYEFNFKRAMDRLSAISDIYKKKAELLDQAMLGSGCDYTGIIGISEMINTLGEYGREGGRNMEQMISISANIERINKREFGGECPAVF
ncbi:MAG: hypothetical protein PHO02_06665 [Candidatus Nanoarchaeia archaeon]|nr:hypothetical protein [Candidatus Nanoarchaeia archaeon]